jgi:hypothetical protein
MGYFGGRVNATDYEKVLCAYRDTGLGDVLLHRNTRQKAIGGYFIKPVFWILAVLYVVIILMDIRELRRAKSARKWKRRRIPTKFGPKKPPQKLEDKQDTIRTLICLGSSVVLYIPMPYSGFIIATTLFLFDYSGG